MTDWRPAGPESGSFSIASSAVALYAVVASAHLTLPWCFAPRRLRRSKLNDVKMALCTRSLLQPDTNCQHIFLTDRGFLSLLLLLEEPHWSESFISCSMSKHRQQRLFNIWAPLSWDKLNVIHLRGSILLCPPGTIPGGLLESGLNLLSLKMEENIHTDISAHRVPASACHLPAFNFDLSPEPLIFLLYISSSPTRLGPRGRRKCFRPDVSFIQAENGRETGKDRRCGGSWLYSHTLLVLKSCTTGTCVKRSLTLQSLYTGTLSDTLGQERASVCTRLDTSGLCFVNLT